MCRHGWSMGGVGYARVGCISNGGELGGFNGWRGEVGCARVGWFSMGRGLGVFSGRRGGLRYALAGWFSHGGVRAQTNIHTKEKKGSANRQSITSLGHLFL